MLFCYTDDRNDSGITEEQTRQETTHKKNMTERGISRRTADAFALDDKSVSDASGAQSIISTARSSVSSLLLIPHSASSDKYVQDGLDTINFLELPTEILLCIIGHLVLRDGCGSWDASGNYRDCSPFEHCPMVATTPLKNSTSRTPSQGNLAIYSGSISQTTSSLLLTSHYMRTLTLRALITLFSGTFRLTVVDGFPKSCDPWFGLTTESRFVAQNELFLSNVEQVEIDCSREIWAHLLSIMPKVKRIKFSASQDVWYRPKQAIRLPGGGRSDYDPNSMNYLHRGLHDDRIIAVAIAGVHKWIEWCRMEETKRSNTCESLEVMVPVRLGAAWDHPWSEWVSTIWSAPSSRSYGTSKRLHEILLTSHS